MPFSGQPLKTLECFPDDFKKYAVWCALALWPKIDPSDVPDWWHQRFWCQAHNGMFPPEDETLPQRCPICDVEGVPVTFRFLPPRPPWDEEEGA
jgi:hypothetical protein